MTLPADLDNDAGALRAAMVKGLSDAGLPVHPAWLGAAEKVPRHAFAPGFHLPADEPDADGLTVWEPVTSKLDYGRWLAAAYSDTTLITQFDGEETDWKQPVVRHGGAPIDQHRSGRGPLGNEHLIARPADRLPPLSVPVHRRGGGREVMREQLARLLACTERPHITVQVLPFPLEAHAAAVGSFVTGPGPAG